MQNQREIPVVETVSDVKRLISDKFKGVANVKLTEDIVSFLLSINTKNRLVKLTSVNAYTESFLENGYKTIGLMHVSSNGVLADGQHRLLALQNVYRSGETFTAWQLVNFGIEDRDTFDIDNGVARSYRDTLILNGVLQDTLIAQSLNAYATLVSENHKPKFTAAILEKIYNEDFKNVLQIGNFPSFKGCQIAGASNSIRPPSWVIAGFRICQICYGTDVMKEAYEQLYSGQDGASPMVKFRIWLLLNRGRVRCNPHSPSSYGATLEMFFNAVKHFIAGDKVFLLRPSKLGKVINGVKF